MMVLSSEAVAARVVKGRVRLARLRARREVSFRVMG
jgi:hypothetical protein